MALLSPGQKAPASPLGRGLGVAVGASICGGEVHLGLILAQALQDPVLFYYVLVRLLVFAERTHRDTITRLHSTDSNNGHMYTRLSKY